MNEAEQPKKGDVFSGELRWCDAAACARQTSFKYQPRYPVKSVDDSSQGRKTIIQTMAHPLLKYESRQ